MMYLGRAGGPEGRRERRDAAVGRCAWTVVLALGGGGGPAARRTTREHCITLFAARRSLLSIAAKPTCICAACGRLVSRHRSVTETICSPAPAGRGRLWRAWHGNRRDLFRECRSRCHHDSTGILLIPLTDPASRWHHSFFSSSGLITWIPQTVYFTTEHISCYFSDFFCFTLFSCRFRAVD